MSFVIDSNGRIAPARPGDLTPPRRGDWIWKDGGDHFDLYGYVQSNVTECGPLAVVHMMPLPPLSGTVLSPPWPSARP